MLFKEEKRYMEIACQIADEGYYDKSRTGIDILKIHAAHMEFSLLDGRVPILSTRKIPVKSPIVEMLWFISGKTDIKYLKDNNVSIWDSWVKPGTEVYNNDMNVGIKELIKQGLISPQAKIDNQFFLRYGASHINEIFSDLFGQKLPERKLLGGSIGEGAYGAQWRKWEDIRIVDDLTKDELVKKGYTLEEGSVAREEIRKIYPDEPVSDERPKILYNVVRKEYDQLRDAINLIKTSSDSRRIIVNAWNPGKLDTMQLPPCFTEDTLIATPQGYFPIKDINIGDIVYSGKGNKQKVNNKWITPYKGEMIEIRPNYISQTIKCTPNHPFLVRGKGFIEAKDIKDDDVLAIPRVKSIKNYIHEYKLKNNISGEEEKFEYELTLDDYFTLGYFIGNGWCSTEKKHRVCFAIPHKKRGYILDKLRKTIKISIKPGKNKSCATYETKSKKLYYLFKNCGIGAFNKKIPDFIMESSIKFKFAFINGYLEADGYTDEQGMKIFTTVSPSLAYGLQRLLLETGKIASIQYQVRPPKTIIEGRIVNQLNTYSINVVKYDGWHSQKKSTILDDEYCWIGIKNINKFNYEGFVYNFEVDVDNTYLANNIITHNCHMIFQFLPFEKDGIKYLDLALTCRSQDYLVGTVFNVMQYGVLCQLVAHVTDRKAHKLYWTGNNTHIYKNQLDIFNNTHRDRAPIGNKDIKVILNSNVKNIDDFTLNDIIVKGYDNFEEPITYPIAV